MFEVKVYINLREGVADPQGATIKHALDSIGYQKVVEVKTGKCLQLLLDLNEEREARAHVEDMCQKILVNPVIEKYDYQLRKIT